MKNKNIQKNNETDQNLKSALMKILLDLNIELPENESTLIDFLQNNDETEFLNKSNREQAENPKNED